MEKKVTGIGGIFFKCDDPQGMRQWYADKLGFSDNKYGTVFEWQKADGSGTGQTVWNTFPKETTYFAPSEKDFMINLRVDNLEWLLGELAKDGITPVAPMQVYDYGKFAHIVDPEGNKLELWEETNGGV
ncbi:MAG: VOC family protein [Chitinophagia bacterium]|nr:VOC family protein [Chitinophagia bacterium]